MTTIATELININNTGKMKKTLISMAAAALMMVSCGPNGLGSLGNLGQIVTDGQTVGNVLQSVLGTNKVTAQNLIGNWSYSGPGCAFTSEQLLAQAGGEVVAAEIKSKLQPTYNQLGISANNTNVSFKQDGTYTATIAGRQLSGNYTFDASSSKVTMKGLLLTINCYAKKNVNGIALLFESSKLLTLLQTVSAMSGNATMTTIGDLSKSYNGLRLCFDFK